MEDRFDYRAAYIKSMLKYRREGQLDLARRMLLHIRLIDTLQAQCDMQAAEKRGTPTSQLEKLIYKSSKVLIPTVR